MKVICNRVFSRIATIAESASWTGRRQSVAKMSVQDSPYVYPSYIAKYENDCVRTGVHACLFLCVCVWECACIGLTGVCVCLSVKQRECARKQLSCLKTRK